MRWSLKHDAMKKGPRRVLVSVRVEKEPLESDGSLNVADKDNFGAARIAVRTGKAGCSLKSGVRLRTPPDNPHRIEEKDF